MQSSNAAPLSTPAAVRAGVRKALDAAQLASNTHDWAVQTHMLTCCGSLASIFYPAGQAYPDEADGVEQDASLLDACYTWFFSQFPLCFGYWKRYAEAHARLAERRGASPLHAACAIYDIACHAVPFSCEHWINYVGMLMTGGADESFIQAVLKDGTSLVALDSKASQLWNTWVEWESRRGGAAAGAAVFAAMQRASFGAAYTEAQWFKFKSFSASVGLKELLAGEGETAAVVEDAIASLLADRRATRAVGRGERRARREKDERDAAATRTPAVGYAVHSDDDEWDIESNGEGVPQELHVKRSAKRAREREIVSAMIDLNAAEMPPHIAALLRGRFMARREALARASMDAASQTKAWEALMGKRSHFHVKALDAPALTAWREYTAYELRAHRADAARMECVFGRVLTATANYAQFWLQYAAWRRWARSRNVQCTDEVICTYALRFTALGGGDLPVLARACVTHLPRAPELLIAYALSLEEAGEIAVALRLYEHALGVDVKLDGVLPTREELSGHMRSVHGSGTPVWPHTPRGWAAGMVEVHARCAAALARTARYRSLPALHETADAVMRVALRHPAVRSAPAVTAAAYSSALNLTRARALHGPSGDVDAARALCEASVTDCPWDAVSWLQYVALEKDVMQAWSAPSGEPAVHASHGGCAPTCICTPARRMLDVYRRALGLHQDASSGSLAVSDMAAVYTRYVDDCDLYACAASVRDAQCAQRTWLEEVSLRDGLDVTSLSIGILTATPQHPHVSQALPLGATQAHAQAGTKRPAAEALEAGAAKQPRMETPPIAPSPVPAVSSAYTNTADPALAAFVSHTVDPVMAAAMARHSGHAYGPYPPQHAGGGGMLPPPHMMMMHVRPPMPPPFPPPLMPPPPIMQPPPPPMMPPPPPLPPQTW